jgi:hypothetical protein
MAWSTPATAVAGVTATAAWINQYLRDNMKAIGDPWTAYTPTWTGGSPTIGNGTLVGSYMQAGKLVHYRIVLTIGSTTTLGSGTWLFTVPVAASITGHQPAGLCEAFDTSGSAITMMFARFNNSTTQIAGEQTGGTDLTNASPYAWAAGDTVIFSGTYEAA